MRMSFPTSPRQSARMCMVIVWYLTLLETRLAYAGA